jgi:hypothetical protein
MTAPPRFLEERDRRRNRRYTTAGGGFLRFTKFDLWVTWVSKGKRWTSAVFYQ